MNKFRLTYLLVALALIAAACGQSEPDVQAIDQGSNGEVGDVVSSEVASLDDTAENDNNANGEPPSESGSSDATPATLKSESSDTTAVADSGGSTTGEPDASTPPATTLDSAEGQLILAAVVADTEAASTGRFEGRLTGALEPDSGQSEASILLEGSFDLDNDATELTIDMSQVGDLMDNESSGDDPLMALGMFPGMFDQPIRLINMGDIGYLQWPFITSLFASFSPDASATSIPASDLWIEGTSDDLGGAADDLGAGGLTDDILPTDLLDQLRDADAIVEDLGPDTVRGAATTHYRVIMDAEAMAAAADEELSSEELAELGALDNQTIDLWVDEQGLARKIYMTMDDTTTSADSDLSDMGLTSVTFEFELFDLGAPVDISAPPADSILASGDLGLGFDEGTFGS